jgi:hypothetical protein
LIFQAAELTLLTAILLFVFLREKRKKSREKKQYADGRQCCRGRQFQLRFLHWRLG